MDPFAGAGVRPGGCVPALRGDLHRHQAAGAPGFVNEYRDKDVRGKNVKGGELDEMRSALMPRSSPTNRLFLCVLSSGMPLTAMRDARNGPCLPCSAVAIQLPPAKGRCLCNAA